MNIMNNFEDTPTKFKLPRLTKLEKEHLMRMKKKIKIKEIKHLIDDILLFKDRPQYVILRDMYPKIK